MNEKLRVISFTSGKGGVGKTNMIVNTAIELASRGKKVLLIDTDMGLANVDIVLGLAPEFNLRHLFSGEKNLEDIIIKGPEGLNILPASSGIQSLVHLGEEEAYGFINAIKTFSDFDYIFLDTGAGISDNVLYFNSVAQDVFIVLTPEPTSLTDGYAIMKVLSQQYKIERFKILINRVDNVKQAKGIYQRIGQVTGHFLNVSLDFAGFVYDDKIINRAIMTQKPFIKEFPSSSVAACIRALVDRIDSKDFLSTGNSSSFWEKMTSGFTGE